MPDTLNGMKSDKNQAFETKVIHAGIEPESTTGAVMTPIFASSTYAQSAPGEHKGYEYSRTDNPTRTVLQEQLAALENGNRALVFASGLSATDAVINLLKSGDHVVAGDDLYGGTHRLFTKVAANRGLEFDFVPMDRPDCVHAAIRENTKLLWLETPSNPLLRIADLAAISKIAKGAGALTAVDNTFMSPYFQRPLEHGIDIVMHSMTKFLNGHSDVVMGALIMNDRHLWQGSSDALPGDGPKVDGSLYQRLKFLQNAVGAVPGPFDCFLVLRGIKTLAVRMERHAQNAGKVAVFLEGHPKVEKVVYPGLASHPGHDLAQRQMSGFGGMITFFLKGDLQTSRKFLSSLEIFTLAESLGGVESLIEHPAIMTHASVPPEIRKEIGISDTLIRASVGIEAADDLIADLEQALAKL